jgi:fucose permease
VRRLFSPLVLASLGFVSLGLPEGLLGVAWPSIRASFDLPLDALGLLLATFASGYFVSSAVSGRFITRLGIGSVLSVSCALTGTCLLGYSLAPSWPAMVAIGALLGIGAGVIDASLNTYAAMAHGPRVLNWMHAAFGLGAAVGPLVMTAILASGQSWTIGYALVAVCQLALSAAYWATRHAYAPPAADAGIPKGPPSPLEQGDLKGAAAGPPLTLGEPNGRERAQRSGTAVTPRALRRNPLLWLSLALFFLYVGLEAGAGQWSYSLYTLSRDTPAAVAGFLVSAYWASLTIGRILFGFIATHTSSETLLRAAMALSILASALIALNLPVISALALALLGLSFAPVFPVLIAETPNRLGRQHTANVVGLEVAAAVVGGAILPALLGVLAARTTLEVVGPALLLGAVLLAALHEALVRLASARRRSARCQNVAAANVQPGA